VLRIEAGMTDAQLTAERLKRERERIVSEWEERVRGAIPETVQQPPSAIRDSVPFVVERIADAVASGDAALLAKAQEHGKERAQSGRYTIEQVIREYHLLEEVLFDVLEARAARRAPDASSAARGDAGVRHRVGRRVRRGPHRGALA
jgi:hypothetical protein